jgi:hypothetical protein
MGYYEKYCKYKTKYFKLKTLLGGFPDDTPKSDDTPIKHWTDPTIKPYDEDNFYDVKFRRHEKIIGPDGAIYKIRLFRPPILPWPFSKAPDPSKIIDSKYEEYDPNNWYDPNFYELTIINGKLYTSYSNPSPPTQFILDGKAYTSYGKFGPIHGRAKVQPITQPKDIITKKIESIQKEINELKTTLTNSKRLQESTMDLLNYNLTKRINALDTAYKNAKAKEATLPTLINSLELLKNNSSLNNHDSLKGIDDLTKEINKIKQDVNKTEQDKDGANKLDFYELHLQKIADHAVERQIMLKAKISKLNDDIKILNNINDTKQL